MDPAREPIGVVTFNARKSNGVMAMVVIMSEELCRIPALGVQIELLRLDGVVRFQQQVEQADAEDGADVRAHDEYPKPVVASEAACSLAVWQPAVESDTFE